MYHILNRSVGKMKLFRPDEDFLADRPVSPLHLKNSMTARNVARPAGQARSAAPLWEEPVFLKRKGASETEDETARRRIVRNRT